MIYLVTHGSKFSGPNPGLNQTGIEQVSALKSQIPNKITRVICGTGKRHLDVAKALDLIPDQYTSLVGEPDSLELDDNQNPIIILADGTKIPEAKLSTLLDNEISAILLLKSLPDDSVICTGRPFLIMLGRKEAKSGVVYGYIKVSKIIINCDPS